MSPLFINLQRELINKIYLLGHMISICVGVGGASISSSECSASSELCNEQRRQRHWLLVGAQGAREEYSEEELGVRAGVAGGPGRRK